MTARTARPTAGALASVALAGAVLAGCGGPSLTEPSPGRPAATPSAAGDLALSGAVEKLRLIAQDGCQTAPAERIFPVCDRYLAELRSAAATVADSPVVPDPAGVRATAGELAAASGAFDRDACGGGPDAGPRDAARCAVDLGRVRAALTTLLGQTQGLAGG